MIYTLKLFSSEFQIIGTEGLVSATLEAINELKEDFSVLFDVWNRPSAREKEASKKILEILEGYGISDAEDVFRECKEYSKYKNLPYIDCTSFAKGLFLTLILDKVYEHNYVEFVYSNWTFNFGGDCIGHAMTSTSVHIKGSKSTIYIRSGFYAVFTSGNYDKRGEHIYCWGSEPYFKSLTLFVNPEGNYETIFEDLYKCLPFMDFLTTYSYSIVNKDSFKYSTFREPDFHFVGKESIMKNSVRYWITHSGESLICKG